MSMYFCNAHKLFEDITQQTTPIRNFIIRLYRANFCRSYLNYVDPVSFSAEKDGVISWTSKISSFIRDNKPRNAIDMFKTMLMGEQRPNYVTFLSVLRAAGALHLKDTSQEIHGLMIKMGFESEMPVVTMLMGVYSIWELETVWKLFDQMTNKDLVLWSAMVSLCVRNGHYVEAFKFFRDMRYSGVQPNHVSIVSILPCCANLGALSLGKQIHGFCIKRPLYIFTNVQNSLLDMYAKCKNLEASIKVFNGMQIKDLISWKTMMQACIANACPRKASMIFSNMHSSCVEFDESFIHDVTLACFQADEVMLGLQVHCCTIKMGFVAFVSIVTALLQMYGKFGEVAIAVNLFDQLHPKDLIAWSVMISVYAQSEHPDNAVHIFKQMQLANESPNEITFVSLLQACSSMRAQELGQSIQAYVTKVGHLSNSFLSSALIDFYCKFGSINQGRALFDETPAKDLISWSSLINERTRG